MLDLMGNIPELQSLFRYSQRGSTLYKINSTNANELSFSVNILDRLHMTSERFSRYIESICSTYPCNMSPGKRAHPIYFLRLLSNRGILYIVRLYITNISLILITYHSQLILEILHPYYLNFSFIIYCSTI